jgi:hypothetical protein
VSSILWLVFAWVVWILLVELFGAEPMAATTDDGDVAAIGASNPDEPAAQS